LTAPGPNLGSQIVRWLARAIGGPLTLSGAVQVATLSVAETLLNLLRSGLASDIRRLKVAILRKAEAEADVKAAEALERLARAAEVVNRANLHKRRDALAEAEKRQSRANAAKTEAEVEAIRMDAETRRMQAAAESQARLLEAISKLRQEGGDLLADPRNLHQVVTALTKPP
jgi:hypothetical protein